MKIYGDTSSGSCLKIRYVADHLQLRNVRRWIARCETQLKLTSKDS